MAKVLLIGALDQDSALQHGLDWHFHPLSRCRRGMDVRQALASDPGICLVLLSGMPSDQERRELGEALHQHGIPLEVVVIIPDAEALRSVDPETCLIGKRRPWLLERRLFLSPTEQTPRMIANLALAARQRFACHRGVLVRRGLVGRSPESLRLASELAALADGESPVLLVGLHGAAAWRHAVAFHEMDGNRASAPLRALSFTQCQSHALPSVLFGSALGSPHRSFTAEDGLFQEAAGGTLVLDGIEHADLHLQARLAQVIETSRVQKVGSPDMEPADVRLVFTASQEALKAGRVHPDLLTILQPAIIRLPSLAEIRADIPAMVRVLCRSIWASFHPHRPFPGFRRDALDRLTATDWHGDREEFEAFLDYFMLISGLSIERPIQLADIESELNNWISTGNRTPSGQERLHATLRFLRTISGNLDEQMNEVRYACLSLHRRRQSNRELAVLLGKSARWVELTIRDLALWSLDSGLRSTAELKRDRIWSRRLDSHLRQRDMGLADEEVED